MSDIALDLKGSKIFYDDSLLIDKKLCFVFGKNGTGKSTITSIFQSQIHDHDIRCFQGFDGIVGEDKKLNAVILGEENNEISEKIKKIEDDITNKEREISEIEKRTLPSEIDPNNLWSDVKNRKELYSKQIKRINNFKTKSASEIKNLSNPQVALPTYNITNFDKEINNAKELSDAEIKKHENIIKSDIKNATKIDYDSIDFSKLLMDTNSLLAKKVTEKEIISEISGDAKKTKFAEDGLQLHSVDERCAFCGNIVNKERYERLQRYFSADDVQRFRMEINLHIDFLNSKITEVKNIAFTQSNFYPEYSDEINQIKQTLDFKQSNVLRFLEALKEHSDNKLKELFEESEVIELKEPESFENEIIEYNKVVVKNNEGDLKSKKEQSKDELRYHEIKKLLDKFRYNDEIQELERLKQDYSVQEKALERENGKITSIKEEIKILKSKIIALQENTKNERILADIINKKMELYVNFNLEYLVESGEKGHYQVKCKNTGDYRDITRLSSGEKNIIAFLYFVQKLNEVDNPKSHLDKLIIFDDPMTSNDDTMQYLIIEELTNLIEKLSNQDKIIIMTHNNHFYLNVKYNYPSYKKNIYLRFLSDGKRTKILQLSKAEEDFKTNYEAMWKELEYLYMNAPSATMLLNPIRRIVETYTKFNSINKKTMLSHVSGAEKMFNVNSHSIDDLESDLNGRNKIDILKMMRECFVKENASNHFCHYWTIDLDSV